MEEPTPNGGEGTAPRSAQSGLLEFAAAAKVGALSSPDAQLTNELEEIIRDVAKTGVTTSYPWDALRQLLVRKVELVLVEFWRNVPDLQLQEGESFEATAVEPLRQSLLEPQREGAPFTVQRLCELLMEPRGIYKSTRKYLYAVQRAILVTSTEEALAAVHKFPEARFGDVTRNESAVAAASAAAIAEAAEAAIATAEAAVVEAPPDAKVSTAAAEAVPAEVEVETLTAAVGPAVVPAVPAPDAELAAAPAAVEPTASNGSSNPGSPGGAVAGVKRKLSPELANGVVAE